MQLITWQTNDGKQVELAVSAHREKKLTIITISIAVDGELAYKRSASRVYFVPVDVLKGIYRLGQVYIPADRLNDVLDAIDNQAAQPN